MKKFFSVVLTVAIVFAIASFFIQASAADEAVPVDITSIVNGQTFKAGSNVSIEVDASKLSVEGVKNIDIYANGVKLPGTIAGISGSIFWYNAPEGEYDITTQVTYVGGAVATGDETVSITVSDNTTQAGSAVVPVASPEIKSGAEKVCNGVRTYRINFDAPVNLSGVTTPATVKNAEGSIVKNVTYTYGTDFLELNLPLLENDAAYTVSIPANTIPSYYSASIFVAATDFTFTTKPNICGSAVPIIKMNYPVNNATVLTDTDFAAKVVAPSSRIAFVRLYKGDIFIAEGTAMTKGEYWFHPAADALVVGETAEFTVKMLDENYELLGEVATATYTGGTTTKYAVKGIYEGAVIVNQHEPVRKITVVDEANLNVVSDVATSVSKVEFYHNEELVATDNTLPYEYDLTWKKYDENKLEIKVYDAFGGVQPFTYTYYVVDGVKNEDESYVETFDNLKAGQEYTVEELKGKAIAQYSSTYVSLLPADGALTIKCAGGSSKTAIFEGINISEGKHKVYYYEFDISKAAYGASFWVRVGNKKPVIFNTYTDVTTNTRLDSYFNSKKPTMRLIIDYASAKPMAMIYFNTQLWKTVEIPALTADEAFLEVSLGDGYACTIDNVKYTEYYIAGVNQAPKISVSAPAEAAIGEAVTLTANATDSDGTVSYVEFYADGALIEGSRTTTGVDGVYTFNWVVASASANPSSVAITAKACDEDGDIGESDAANIAIVIKNPPVVAITSPAANAVYNVSTAEGFTSVKPSIIFTASDSDGTITDISVYVNDVKDGSVANPGNATGYTLTNALTAGTYTIKVVVTDNSGMVSNASVKINVVQQETVTAPSYAVKGIYEGATIVAQHEKDGRIITIVDSANANIVSDVATSVDRVEFYKNNVLVDTDYSKPYTYNLTFDKYGVNSFEARVYDIFGTPHPFSYTYNVANGVENSASFEENFDDTTKDYSTHESLAALFVGGDGANITSTRLALSVGAYPAPATGMTARPTDNTLIITPKGTDGKAAHLQFKGAPSTTGARVHYYDFDILLSEGNFRRLWLTADGYTGTTNAHLLFNNKKTTEGIGTNSALNKSDIVNIRLVLDYSGATPTALVYKNGELWQTIPMTNLANGTSDPVVSLYVQNKGEMVCIDNFSYTVYDAAPEPKITYDSLQTDGKISLTAKPANMEDIKGTIVATLYDTNDHVSEVNTYDAAASVDVEFVQTTGDYIKLFWLDFASIYPYSPSVKIDF